MASAVRSRSTDTPALAAIPDALAGAGTDGTPPPDHGLYGPDSEAWALNREAALLLAAGPRALLLQVAHPLVAEGVEQHSDFRRNPWRRLQGTLRSYLTIVYGSTAEARAEIRRLNTIHRAIAGPVRDPGARARFGDRYLARDPELSLWVHATLVDSTIVAYDWIERLPRQRREAFYAETRPIGRAFGIPDDLLPRDHAAFEAYMERMVEPGGPVSPTPTAREIADAILAPPLGPVIPVLGWVPPPLYAWVLWPSVGLLPDGVREAYGLPWGVPQRLVSTWLVTAWRAWRPILAASFRQMPLAQAADRRVMTAPGDLPAVRQ